MSGRLAHITGRCGQQIWLDNLSRSLIDSGKLQAYIDQGVTGVTSNPAIFFQAISRDAAYQEKLKAVSSMVSDPETRYEIMVLQDIQDACDLLMPVYEKSGGKAGFVSFEVSPNIANDALMTIAEAKRLWRMINRKNAMIKIPATSAGLHAIEEVIREGIHVNVTLIFSPKQLLDVQQAYIRGISRRIDASLSVAHIVSVASLFISRVDSLVDKLLADRAPQLQGKIAVSAAKMNYHHWLTDFLPKINELAAALPQTLLWASTGVKNPAYPDLLYVDQLLGSDTINTIPEDTLIRLLSQQEDAECLLCHDLDEAQSVLKQFEVLGFDINEIGEILLKEGLIIFEEAYQKLIDLVA